MLGVGRDRPAAPAGVPAEPAAHEAERDAHAVLASVHGLGPVTLSRLVLRLGSARDVLRAASGARPVDVLVEASRGDDGRAGAMGENVARAIVDVLGRHDAILGAIRDAGLEVVTLGDLAYPVRLRQIELPPPVLFVRGAVASLAVDRPVALVGTRRPTPAGRLLAGRIAAALVRSGAAVVSGLAVGIDGAAHAATLAEGGTTVAVLGGGHDRLYPAAHRPLADEIVRRGGAVVSELPPWTDPTPGTFPRRNRLIAGLAESTVVVEAGIRSGALITAAWALEQGRGCFLVPGSLEAPASAGCLAFLRECPGEARIVAGIPELLQDLGLVGAPQPSAEPHGRDHSPASLSAEAVLGDIGGGAAEVARALVAGSLGVDELVARTGLPVATVLAALTVLEARGYVVGAYGRYVPAGQLARVSGSPA